MISVYDPDNPGVFKLQAGSQCPECGAAPRPFALHCLKCHVTFWYDAPHACLKQKADEAHLQA